MDIKKHSFCTLLFLLLALLSICRAEASVQLTVTPTARNVFVLEGKGFDHIAALDLELSYDPAVMINPQGHRGSLIPGDAIFNFNPSVPGQIRLFIRVGAQAVNGNGTVATIGFDGVGDALGNIVSVRANLVSVKATPVSAGIQILRQMEQPVKTEETDVSADASTTETIPVKSDGTSNDASITETKSAGTTTGATVVTQARTPVVASGAVPRGVAIASMAAAHESTKTENKNQEMMDAFSTEPVSKEQPPADLVVDHNEPGPVAPENSTVSPEPRKKTVYQSILHRMKGYKKNIEPADVTALFRPDAGQKIHQEPSVVISDGESVLSIRVELPPALKKSPSFSFRNASMLSLEQSDDGSWLIVLMPKKDALEGSVTVRFDGNIMFYPLVLVPSIDPDLLTLNGSAEATLTKFLKHDDKARDPRFDLNGDGRFDYVDDYIFAAQYLAARQKPARNVSTGE